MNLTLRELTLVEKYCKNRKAQSFTIERNSNKEFDLLLKGQDQLCSFSAWLPLAAINQFVRWTEPTVATLTEYPEMAMAGDWSAVRDSADEQIWGIFDKFVSPQLKKD